MKTTLPLIVGVIAGVFAFGELYVPHPSYRALFEHLRDFAQILAASAFILGGLNVLQVNYPKIRRRELDWQFKVVMLVGAVIMGLAGIRWHTMLGDPKPQAELTIRAGEISASEGPGAAIEIRSNRREALARVNGAEPLRAWHAGDPADVWTSPGDQPLRVPIEPGQHNVVVMMPVAGYTHVEHTFDLGPGQVAVIEAELTMMWGAQSPEGRVFTWFYDYVFFPCNATMFALLAFFIASAAFRAFRARNVESALLLGAAILVMLGLVPIGRAISPFFPELADWIVEIPNTAGRRAILMGAALGAIVTGLRVILGLERSHLGSE